jgi:hypothetical protein
MFFLSYTPLVLLLATLAVLACRKAYETSPWFFVYLAFAVTGDVARLVAQSRPSAYFSVYWITEAGYDLLGILVMYEVFRSVLGRLTRVWWVRLIFPAVLLLSIALAIARNHSTAAELGGRLMVYIVIGELAVRFIQVLVFAGLVSLVPLIGLRWRQHPFGIATGFGVYSTAALLATTKFSDFGTKFKLSWGITLLVSYSIAVLIWLWFFAAPEKQDTASPIELSPSPVELEQYKKALGRNP